MRFAALAAAAVAAVMAACSTSPDRSAAPTTTASPAAATSVKTSPTTTSSTVARVDIALRLDRRVSDEATITFGEVVRETLLDQRGWERAGFRFSFSDQAPYTVVLAEGDQVDRLCQPYDTGGRFSCQIGPVVVLNADRWRGATRQVDG